jgi:hypothetical protein
MKSCTKRIFAAVLAIALALPMFTLTVLAYTPEDFGFIVAEGGGGNLAYGAVAEQSSAWNDSGSLDAQVMFDGNRAGDRWAPSGVDFQPWMIADFGDDITFNTIVFFPWVQGGHVEGTRLVEFTIEVSPSVDGDDWTEVLHVREAEYGYALRHDPDYDHVPGTPWQMFEEETYGPITGLALGAEGSGPATFEFDTVTARRMRFTQLENAVLVGRQASIHQIEVYYLDGTDNTPALRDLVDAVTRDLTLDGTVVPQELTARGHAHTLGFDLRDEFNRTVAVLENESSSAMDIDEAFVALFELASVYWESGNPLMTEEAPEPEEAEESAPAETATPPAGTDAPATGTTADDTTADDDDDSDGLNVIVIVAIVGGIVLVGAIAAIAMKKK